MDYLFLYRMHPLCIRRSGIMIQEIDSAGGFSFQRNAGANMGFLEGDLSSDSW